MEGGRTNLLDSYAFVITKMEGGKQGHRDQDFHFCSSLSGALNVSESTWEKTILESSKNLSNTYLPTCKNPSFVRV